MRLSPHTRPDRPWPVAARQGQKPFDTHSLKTKSVAPRAYQMVGLPALLAACGGAQTPDSPSSDSPSTGFPDSYTPPISVYTPPSGTDPNAFALSTPTVQPYWVAALSNSEYNDLPDFFQSYDNVLHYMFPETMPDYYTGENAEAWASASPEVRTAFLEIFAKVEQVLDLTFVQTTDLHAPNTLAISQNNQPGLAGYAYFPNSDNPLGSDILISNDYDSPSVSAQKTNLDYELLLHELAHALGLKHPFEADGTATEVLPTAEDKSAWTVATYTQNPADFDGFLRDFDLMALSGLFGVNPNHQAGDDSYSFSSQSGVFILDGAGRDTITSAAYAQSAHIDLRPNMQSYLGEKNALVTAPFQLTLSAGSDIETAIGGAGDDYLIGNALDNLLVGGAGDDRIFAGEGQDVVQGGLGQDQIDLSELSPQQDTVTLLSPLPQNGTDTIYGFQQGASGDKLDLTLDLGVALLPVVSALSVPVATVSDTILRLVGDGLETATDLARAFLSDGAFSALTVPDMSHAVAVTAASQATGEDQQVFYLSNTSDSLSVYHLAVFKGHDLDIDAWHSNNFI